MRRLLLAFALLASPASGQVIPPNPPPAPAPAPIKPQPVASVRVPDGPLYAGDLIILDGSASIGDLIDWELISPADVTTYAVDSGGKTVAFANKAPGTYVFLVRADSVINNTIARSKQRIAFTTVSSTPTPGPTPKPDPIPPVPPDPAPPTPGFAGHVHATLVFDVDEPSTAQLRASTVKADLKALAADWYVAPTVGPVAKLFAKYTTADGLPTVYFTDDAGKMLGTVKAPTTKDQVIQALKTIRGVK